ncbi:MAG: molybdopterin molybdotransferase MoeA [Planctomycetes bacterium]|nr:molybdopterin molybdotransferase MoeA [Planctomycetota bacterium]
MTGEAFDDVRMRGFHRRVTLAEALGRIVEGVPPLAAVDEVPLREAPGRLLAADFTASLDLPSFDRSAMDGFAVVAGMTFAATAYDPAVLEVAGESLPGAPWEGVLAGARAVRIMTGAPLPEGADAVVPAEFAEEERGFVRVSGPVSPGRNVGRAGEDVARGAVALEGGRILRPQDAALLAALGAARVPVAPRPRIGILATGNEIVRQGAALAPFHVHDANTPLLQGLAERWGAVAAASTLQPDEAPRIRRALGRLLASPGVDIVLATGGSSVGVEDHMPSVVAGEGRLLFHGVALRPAGPVGLGIVSGKPVFLLPGNPVSVLCAFDLLVGPCLRRLQGLPAVEPYARVPLPLTRRLASVAGRTDYARVALAGRGVEPLAVSGASILSSAVRAGGFVVVPPEVEGWDEGETVEVHLY